MDEEGQLATVFLFLAPPAVMTLNHRAPPGGSGRQRTSIQVKCLDGDEHSGWYHADL